MLNDSGEAASGIMECQGIEATDDVCGRVTMLEFNRKGVALLLTYGEALALGRVLSKMGQATRQHRGGENGYRA